jgi:hypothetical protein
MANGVYGTEFKRRRGVRQGYPLSPLLLMAGSDLLQYLINVACTDVSPLFALRRHPPNTSPLNQHNIELIDRARRQEEKN